MAYIPKNIFFFPSLIQAQLGCIPIQDFTLTQDTGRIFRNGLRVTRCMVKFNPFFGTYNNKLHFI